MEQPTAARPQAFFEQQSSRDAYVLYQRFEEAYRDWYTETFPEGQEKEDFISRCFSLMTRDDFDEYFSELSGGGRSQLIARWTHGFRAWLDQALNGDLP